MIDFLKKDDKIVFRYTPEMAENWVKKALAENDDITFKKSFTFNENDLIETEKPIQDDDIAFDEFEPTHFIFAILQGSYYKVTRGVITSKFDIFIYNNVPLTVEYFVADSTISIFNTIEKLINQDFYIGGDSETAISIEGFEDILQQFPTPYEKKLYAEARVSSVLKNYFDNVKNVESQYQKYLNKKVSKEGTDLIETYKDFEVIKYQAIYDKLEEMLKDEDMYNEIQWQNEILQIILLLYPKYIFVFKEVPVHARISQGIKEKSLDFLLVDSNGNVDIVEIKKPFENAIMTKGVYRDNYIPLRELSGTVMQLEKYIYYLNRWSEDGEKYLTEKYKTELPQDFSIKITNPNGLIIMGRENNLSIEQKQDFEIVKRKYRNVVDIITYDDLLKRLSFMIEQLTKTS